MHELAIAQNIKSIVEENIKDKEMTVCKIKVQVGKLRAVVPDFLKYSFQYSTEGTSMQGAELEINEIPVNCKCKNCGAKFTIEEPLFICPNCGSQQIDVLTGMELLVESIELVEG
jgi:hydrogenase nickel incorporation protein HypA/HybF